MAYNYAKEKRKFDADWKRKALWYRKEGMSEEDIEAIHGFDLAQFNRDRAYESRRRPLETACGSYYIRALETDTGRYSWIDEITDSWLADRLQNLTKQELELLTLIVIEGKTHKEAADILSCSRQYITKQLAQIRKIFKKE